MKPPRPSIGRALASSMDLAATGYRNATGRHSAARGQVGVLNGGLRWALPRMCGRSLRGLWRDASAMSGSVLGNGDQVLTVAQVRPESSVPINHTAVR